LYFDFEDPTNHPFDIEEIAHALSHICRFTGHVKHFYSVAQHSVNCSWMAPKSLELTTLMHDASEAYLGDVSTHLKRMLPEYMKIEEQVEEALALKFGTFYPLPQEVKDIDGRMLMTEVRDLMPKVKRQDWPKYEDYPGFNVVRSWPPEEAKQRFLDRYNKLKGINQP
jgi:hypothetical protein